MSRALRWLISGTLLLIGSFSFGQANNLFFRHLNTNDGLSNNTVYSINDDTLGFIWIGTRSGLNRFDGYSFRIYDNRSGLKNTMINIIFRDSKGRIWVGTQGGGLSRYAYETDTFTSFSNSPADSSSISHDDVQAIDEDSQGRIWIGTHEGALNRLDETKNKFVRIRLQEGLSPDFHINRINTILFENDTLLWIGTLDGLYRYNPKRDKVFPVLMDGKPLNRRVLCICNEGPVRIWLGTNNGIVGYDKLSHTAQYITTANSALTNDLILVIKRLQDGRLMIGTDGGGLDIYNPLTREITAYMSNPNAPYSLSNNSVYEIFIDRYNGLWVGNYIGGINYYSEFDWKFLPVQHEVNDLESLSDNHVRSFYQDSEGDIWIGTLGGLNQYNPNSGKFKTYTFNRNVANTLSSNTVLSMNEDHQGALWIGTYGGGISIFDKKRGTFRKFSHPDDLSHSLDKADIYGIVETTNKKICAASLGGIYLFDMNTGRMKRFQTSNSRLSNNTVKVLYLDRQGNIWAGTNQGINKFNPETGEFKVYTHSNTDPNSLTNNRILSITESKDGKLWIGTEGGGVGIFDPASENFSCLTSAEGLPDNVVNSVLQDNLGVFWFGTNKGLVRYDHIQKKLQVYTAADGLQANAFNQNAALKARDGKLFFGGINGFNVFYPGNLVSNLYPPKVILTDLYISNKLVNPGDEPLATQLFLQKKLTLNYQTNFEIHFSALGFINKGLYKYSYSLKGLDTAWTEYRDIRTVNYTNLNPGIYTLMVRAINSDGVISENPATLTIHILSPWWKTWWAYIVYTLVILGLLFLFMKFNISWIHVKNQLLLERKEKEQQEELNQLKLGFFTNISHEFKTPLTLILGHLDNLKEFSTGKQAETLNHIEKNAKRLLILINQLLEFRKAEIGLMKLKAGKGNIVLLINGIKASFDELAMKKNIGFEFICPVAIPEIWFDSEKIEKIVFNLLSNAFKHVDSGGKIEIEASVVTKEDKKPGNNHDGYFEISIRDSGCGIAPEDLGHIFDRFYISRGKEGSPYRADNSGIGLAYSKRLVELHHGDISASSELGVGSVFSFRIPIGKNHLKDEEIKEETGFELKLDYQALSGEYPALKTDHGIALALDEKKPILLVVDDNPQICDVIAEKFQSGYHVLIAYNGADGLENAKHYIPDAIISDILMPGMDGIEFCQKIKEDLHTCHIPIILLTAKSGDENQIIGMKTGADGYISKPYNPELLEAMVENLIGSRKILRNKFTGNGHFTPAEVVNNKLDEQFLLKLISLIEGDLESVNVDIAWLCREVAMSRSVLYRKLKALTGKSIQDFVRIVKLRKASRILLETNLTISEVSFQSGFANTKHFSTAFKKQFGKTPSEFRHVR